MREFGGPARRRTFALVFQLTQALSLLIAFPHTFLADVRLLPGIAPFLPLAGTIVRIVVQSRRRRHGRPDREMLNSTRRQS
jgi:hypothetical protein